MRLGEQYSVSGTYRLRSIASFISLPHIVTIVRVGCSCSCITPTGSAGPASNNEKFSAPENTLCNPLQLSLGMFLGTALALVLDTNKKLCLEVHDHELVLSAAGLQTLHGDTI